MEARAAKLVGRQHATIKEQETTIAELRAELSQLRNATGSSRSQGIAKRVRYPKAHAD